MKLFSFSIRIQLYSMIAFVTGAFLCFGLWSRSTLSIAKVNGPYYDRIVQGKDLVADILPPPEYIIESYLTVLEMTDEVQEGATSETLAPFVEKSRQLRKEYDERHDFWVASLPEGKMRQNLLVDSYDPAVRFYDLRDREFIPACLAGDAAQASTLARGELRDAYLEHRKAIDDVVQQATAQNAATETEAAELVATRTFWSNAFVLGVLAGTALAGWLVIRTVTGRIAAATNRLTNATTALRSSNRTLEEAADSTSSESVAMASSVTQVSANVDSLASASDQLGESIREIAGSACNAAGIAESAVSEAESADAAIARLGESSASIGAVIDVINSLAEQTNLLALNATIEAARAGEAGKGFAVVANEVKELANETSSSTSQITEAIKTIQADSQAATEAVKRISNIIAQVAEAQQAIASAVEEQSATTTEMSHSIGEVASAGRSMSDQVDSVSRNSKYTAEQVQGSLDSVLQIAEMVADLRGLLGSVEQQTETVESGASEF